MVSDCCYVRSLGGRGGGEVVAVAACSELLEQQAYWRLSTEVQQLPPPKATLALTKKPPGMPGPQKYVICKIMAQNLQKEPNRSLFYIPKGSKSTNKEYL